MILADYAQELYNPNIFLELPPNYDLLYIP